MNHPHSSNFKPLAISIALLISPMTQAAITTTGDVTPAIPENGVVAAALRVGKSAAGSLEITAGSKVTSADQSSTGGNSPGVGTATVDGAGSTWTVDLPRPVPTTPVFGTFSLGANGKSTVTVSAGGKIETTGDSIKLFMGRYGGSSSNATVTGAGSSIISNYGLYVANGTNANGEKPTSATLNILDQGSVISQGYMRLGHEPFSTGTVNINKGKLTVSGTGGDAGAGLGVGTRGGVGNMTIENGGLVDVYKEIWIGRQKGSTGTVTVTGVGSLLKNRTDGLWVGGARSDTDLFRGYGTGTLSIVSGGKAISSSGYVGYHGILVDATQTSNGTVTIDGVGSRWTITNHLNVGGTVTAPGGTANVAVKNGGQLYIGTSSLVKNGTLGIYSDNAQVNLEKGGRIIADIVELTKGSFNFTGGTLSTGTFKGNLVQNGPSSSLAPVSLTATGTTKVTGDYTLTSGYDRVEISGISSFDKVTVTGAVNLGANARLSVKFLGGFTPTAGNSFVILTGASVTGTFKSVSFPTVAGVKFELQYLPNSVQINVVANPV